MMEHAVHSLQCQQMAAIGYVFLLQLTCLCSYCFKQYS